MGYTCISYRRYTITNNPLLQFILKQFQQQDTLTHKQFTDREQLKVVAGHNFVVFYYRVHRVSILHHTVFSKVLSASWNLPQNYFQHFPTTKIVPDHNIHVKTTSKETSMFKSFAKVHVWDPKKRNIKIFYIY